MKCFRAVGVASLLLWVAVSVSGCAWTKAGATQEEFQETRGACGSEALKAYPPTYVDVEVPAYAVAGDTHCTTTTEKDGKTTTDCKSDAPTLYPAHTDTVDAYALLRSGAIDNCMISRGWKKGLCSFPFCDEWKWGAHL